MVLGLGKLTDAVHERERLGDARKLERPLERIVDLCPAFLRHETSIYHRLRMTASSENAPVNPLEEPRRAGRELLLEGVFRPVANLFVPLLRRSRVAPPVVVLANAAVGLTAAAVVARGDLIAAALLLQLKTLLDNMDGQLARATGQVSLAGRYLDTEADLVVNAAVLAALGHVTGEWALAAGAFVALTLVLAVDFNLSELRREQRGTSQPPPPRTGAPAERALERIYSLVFGPLDRWVRRLVGDAAVDGSTVTALANLGLTTQLAALGVCLLIGEPEAYLWLVLASLLVTSVLLLRLRRAT